MRFRFTTTVSLTSGLVLGGLLLGISARAVGQTGNQFVPGPFSAKCGSFNGPPTTDSSSDGKDLFKKAIAALDPQTAYRSHLTFKLNGATNSVDTSTAESNGVGSFTVSEDHSKPSGDFNRTFTTNGVATTASRSAGQYKLQLRVDDTRHNPSRLAFTPKLYVFPLAVLVDEMNSTTTTLRIVRTGEPIVSGGALRGLLHVQSVNTQSADTVKFETEDWYLDPKTFSPLYVRHELPSFRDRSTCVVLFTSFRRYETINGLLAPTQITNHSGGRQLRQSMVESINF